MRRPHIMLVIVFTAISAILLTLRFIIEPANQGEIVDNKTLAKILPITSETTPRPIITQAELQVAAFTLYRRLFGDKRSGVDFNLVEPIEEFRQRITKKQFGTFITPETSPVENDRFTGYHTGVDAEFVDSQDEIPVLAIADGTIIVRTWATGYGGLIVLRHIINDVPVFALYGHLDKKSFLPPDIVNVKAGDRLGVLGDNYTEETDGIRKHLHFSIYHGEKIDFRGYVQNEEELVNWLNPLDFY